MVSLFILVCSASIFWATQVVSQTCSNFGVFNGSSCVCPPGFGGANCSSLACGGNIFQGSSRNVISTSPGNLTSSSCGCEAGWTGTGCNVCQSSNACQNGYGSSSIGQSSTVNGIGTQGPGQSGSNVGVNNTLVCNTAQRVWAAGEMSCSVTVCRYHTIWVWNLYSSLPE
jgi:hypothetical protein